MISKPLCVIISSVCLLAAVAVVSHQAGAARPAAKSPTVVVSIALQRVMDGLEQRAEAEQRLSKMRDEMNAEKDKREKDANALIEQGKALKAQMDAEQDAAKKAALRTQLDTLSEQANIMMVNNQVWAKYAFDRVDIEQSLLLKNLYQAIRDSIKSMASERGYDIVLVDDSQGELGANPESRLSRRSQIDQQILDRRMLYSGPAADITAELIDYMNTARAAAPAAAGAKP